MKKNLFILSVVAALAACENPQVNYSVRGTVPDSLNGKQVQLYACQVKDSLMSTTTVADGRFEFSGILPNPVVARVAIEGESRLSCVLDKEPVVVNYDGRQAQVTGSHRTEAMVAYDAFGAECSKNIKRTKIPNAIPMLLSGQRREYTEEEKRELKEVQENNRKVSALYDSQLTALMKQNLDNVVGAYLFGYFYKGNGVEKDITVQDSILSVAGKEFLATPIVQRCLKAQNQRVGRTYSDIELPDKDGKLHKLSDYVGEGRYVLLDVWASWCVGCRMETPNVIEAYKKYHDRGFDVVMVSIDVDEGNSKWLKAMEKDSITDMGLQLIDRDSKIRKVYGIASIPCSMLIGPDGKIIANNLRNNDLEENLSKHLGE